MDIFGLNHPQHIQRRSGERYNSECPQPPVKHGGGAVVVWGSDDGDLVKNYQIMNAEKYSQILIHHSVPSGKHLIGNNFVFHHDNDPKHTAYQPRKTHNGAQCTTLLKLCGIRQSFEFPSRSLENYSWRLRKEITWKLPTRVQAVLKNKDGHTICICLISCVSMYVSICFSKLLHLFSQQNIKKGRVTRDFWATLCIHAHLCSFINVN